MLHKYVSFKDAYLWSIYYKSLQTILHISPPSAFVRPHILLKDRTKTHTRATALPPHGCQVIFVVSKETSRHTAQDSVKLAARFDETWYKIRGILLQVSPNLAAACNSRR